MSKIEQWRFLVKMEPVGGQPGLAVTIPGWWSRVSGGVKSVAVTREYDGGSKVPDLFVGRPEYSDLTISRNYDSQRDGRMLRTLDRYVGTNTSFQVNVHDVDANLAPTGNRVLYFGVLKSVTDPDIDANSDRPATCQIVLSVYRKSA